MKPGALKKFVNDLELSPSKHPYPGVTKRNLEETTTPADKETSFVNEKSLVSFAAEVSLQNRADLLNSLLLAQLSANKQFSSEDELEKWYRAFFKLMNKLGWVIETSKTTEYKSKGTVIEIESVVIDILESAIGGKVVEIARSLISAFKGLADDKEKKFIAFEKNTHSLKKGCFLFGVATEKNETLSVTFCFILLSSSHEIKQILFFRSKEDESKLKTASFKGTLNVDTYAPVRQIVIDKLKDNVAKSIAEIDI